MRYDDASNAGSMAADSTPIARADVDALPPGSFGPASGNAITGTGTVSGVAGADQVGDAPGKIVEIQGAGGTSNSGDNLQASGQYGVLSMDAQGNYNYVRNGGTPDGVRDVFRYTLADADGATSSTTLTIDIASQLTAEGVVNLPAGVEMSDIRVNGRDLVIQMPDGSQMVIPGGAVFVPNLVIGDVQVPPSNLAALLIESEPQPAAGSLQSSGGNFAVDVPPLDPGVPLGDLIPPTELGYTPPTFEEVNQFEDEEPTIVIIPDDQPAAVNAVDSVDESGLPARGSEPAGTLEPQPIETTAGVISFEAGDGLESITINGVAVASVGQVIAGERGNLTITSINLATGQIGYTYTVTDNTTDGVDDFDDFTIVVTDDDGDTATGTLHIDIADDEPIARNDTDSLSAGQTSTDGNVWTGVGTTSGSAGADTPGADGVEQLTGIRAGTTGNFTTIGGAAVSVAGQYGTLLINPDGSYVYTRSGDAGGTDVFTYQITDGDGDVATATLTITVPADLRPTLDVPVAGEAGTSVDEAGLPPRGTEPPGTGEVADGNALNESDDSETTTGTINFTPGDGPATVTIDGLGAGGPVVITGAGQTIVGQYGTLTITGYNAAAGTITYSYTLGDNTIGDATHDDFIVVVTDADGDTASDTLRIDIVDDTPIARNDTDAVTLDNPITGGNVVTGVGTTNNGADTPGADGVNGETNDAIDGVTGIRAGTTGAFTAVPQSGSSVSIVGQYGTLSINNDGTYTYTRTSDPQVGGTDVFTYQLTDGDGDVSTATLTITVPARPDVQPAPNNATAIVDDDGLPQGNHDSAPGDDVVPNTDGDNNEATFGGTLTANFGTDGPGTFSFASMDGDSGVVGQENVVYSWNEATDVLTATVAAGEDRAGLVLFTVQLNPVTGEFDVTLVNNILQVDDGTNTENNATALLTFTATDADNDSTNGTLTITFDDDIPVAITPPPPPQGEPQQPIIGGLVDEDDLPDGNKDDAPGDDDPVDAAADGDPTTTGGNAGSLAALFNAGADQPLTFSLGTNFAGLIAQDLSSNGVPLSYAVDGNVLTASANGETIFTLTVNSNGSWVFNLEGQLDHSVPGFEDNIDIDFSSVIIATDADGDSVPAAAGGFVITVDDDMPKPFNDPDDPNDEVCPDDVITVNNPGSTFTGDLNLPPVGADDPGTVSFSVEDGDPVLGTGGDQLTSDGQPLFYFVNNETGLLEARAGGEGGEVVFTIQINDNGTFTYEQFEVIDNGAGGITFDDLTSTSAGNAEFRGVGADDAVTTVDLLLSAEAAGADATVNTDSDSIGAANQSVDAGETVRIDFVSNLTSGAATPSGFSYDGHVSSNSFIGFIPQVQGSQAQTVAFTVFALDTTNTSGTEPDRDPAGGFSDSTITAITEVTVTDYLSGSSTTVDVTGFATGVFVPVNYGISVRVNADGSVTFSGIQQGDSYGFSTGTNDFNAVAVQGEATGTGGSTENSFDLGVFSIGVVDAGDPVGISVPIAYTDADGDPVVCDIDVVLNPSPIAGQTTVTVNEAGIDGIGSEAGSDSETASGDLSTTASGTGPFTFALAPGQSGNGTYGTLVLNSDGTYTYTLDTPVDSSPAADDGTNPEVAAETFTYQVTDANGVTTTGTIRVSIIDDVPTASNDTDTIASGSLGPATGNVITDAAAGDAGDSDAGADTLGADGLGGVTAIASNNVPANTDSSADGSGNYVVNGQYGTLTINEDGSYSYARNAGTPGGVSDVFTYTLVDGDGDTTTATLTIAIANNPPTAGQNPTVQLDDDALAGGNAGGTGDDANSVNTSGTLSGAGGDGTLTFSVQTTGAPAGFTYVSGGAGVVLVQQAGVTVLTVTVNPNGTYSVVQNAPIDHSVGGNENNVQFTINYTVTDVDGQTANGTLNIDVDDDTPVAANDTDTIASGSLGPATGNVITDTAAGDAGDSDTGADSPGADGLGGVTAIASNNVPANTDATADGSGNYVVNGQYGTLTINQDGSYSYARNAGTPGGVSDVFTYTLADGDGDTTTATLTIAIGNNTPSTSPNPTVQLDDDALAGGNAGGNGDDANSVNTSGTLSGSGGDGTLTFSVQTTGAPAGFTYVSGGAGVVLVQQAGVTVLTVTVNANGTYSVVQNAPIDHSAGGNENNVQFTINYTVTDADGSTANGTLNIDVDDDTPVAANDTDTIASGSLGPATGNVITDAAAGDAGDSDTGADSPGADGLGGVTAIASNNVPANTDATADGSGNFVVNGQYGTLTINEDGSYSYARNAGTPGGVSDVFTYTLADGDGDTTTATLTIAIGNNTPTVGQNGTVQLDDDALPGGIAGGVGDDPDAVNVSGTLSGSGGDGALTFSVQTSGAPAGFTYVSGGAGVVLVQQGGTTVLTVTVNANGTYSVVQNAPIDHPAGDNENNQLFTINYTVTDADGSTANGTLNIDVDDDTPVTFTTADVNVEQFGTASASLDTDDGDITDNYGADGGTVRFSPDLDGVDTELTSNGAKVYYNVVSNTVIQGVLADNTVVFTITLNPTDVTDPNNVVGSSYTIDLVGKIDSFTTVDFNDGSYDFVGGNDAWAGFNTAANDDSSDLLITPILNGAHGSTVNTNATVGGVGSGNSVGAGEAIRIDFVTDLGGNTAGAGGYGVVGNRDHSFDAHYNTNGASALFQSTTGSTIKITAYDDPDGNNIVGDGTVDPITAVAISYGTGTPLLISANGTYEIDGHSYTVTFNGDGTVSVAGVVGEPGSSLVGTHIATYTATGYNSLTFAYEAGDTFKVGDFGAAVQTTDPKSFSVPVEIVDGDGDVVAGDSLDITVYPVGGVPAAVMATSSVESSAFESSSLLASNDDTETQQKQTNTNNTVLTAALAAAGLAAEPLAASTVEAESTSGQADVSVTGGDYAPTVIEADAKADRKGSDVDRDRADRSDDSAQQTRRGRDDRAENDADEADETETSRPAELLAGTEAESQTSSEASANLTADAIMMPDAGLLIAAAEAQNASGEPRQSDVGKVLADALNGGGDGPDLDAVLNALAGGGKPLEGVTSPVHGAVSNGDTAEIAGFTAPATMPTMDEMAVHQDAAPAYA